MNIEDLFPTPKHSIWDNEVPIIVSEDGNITAYLSDQINEPFTYNELCHRLRTAPEGTTTTLHINTPGGIIDSALMIIDAIKQTKAKVVAHLTGTVASAGTIISLACDELVLGDHLTFMIHNYSSSGISGKGHELKAYQQFVDVNLEKAFRDFYVGFLTDKEMSSVIDGQDLWMTKEEVATRWIKKKALLKDKTPFETEAEVVSSKKRGRPSKKALS